MARHAPGLSPSELRRMTPEETRLLTKVVVADVEADRKRELVYVQALMKASGARLA